MRICIALVCSFFALLSLTNDALCDWIDAKESGRIVYFLFDDTPRVERFDLDTASWLAPLPLTDPPTAFHADADGIYISTNTRVYRMDLNGNGEAQITDAANAIIQCFTIDHLLYLIFDAYTGDDGYRLVDKNTGDVIFTGGDPLQGVSVAYNARRLVAKDKAIFPQSACAYDLNEDGTLGATASDPYRFQTEAEKTYIYPDETRFVDSTGIVYHTADLTYAGSFGGPFKDMVFMGQDPFLIRDDRIIRYSPEMVEMGSVIFEAGIKHIFTDGQKIIGFAPQPEGNGIHERLFSMDEFAHLMPETPASPLILYTPDQTLMDDQGIVYLLNSENSVVHRWSVSEREYLSSIPLIGAAEYMAYSNHSNCLFLAYPSGMITKVVLTSPFREIPFANVPFGAKGIAAAGEYLFACPLVIEEYTGRSDATLHLTLSESGQLADMKYWDSPHEDYFSEAFVWSPLNRKILYVNWQSRGLRYIDIDASGAMANDQYTTDTDNSGFNLPIRISPSGRELLFGSGMIYDAQSFDYIGAVNTEMDDGAWGDNEIYTLHNIDGCQVRKWSLPDYNMDQSFQMNRNRTPIAVFATDNGVLAISQYKEMTLFSLLDNNLNVIEHTSPPVLSRVTLYRVGPPLESTTNFRLGDSMVIEFDLSDPDLDCSALEITEFSPPDAKTQSSPPALIRLPSQPEETMTAHSAPAVISGESGDSRLRFRLQDAEGNWSNIIEMNATISAAGSTDDGGGGGGGCYISQLKQ